MIIFCDRLSLGVCFQAIRLRGRNLLSREKTINIQVLDQLPDRGWSTFLRVIMQYLGFHVDEAEFIAGHLQTKNGESVYLAAGRTSNDLALQAAERILARSKFLERLNHKWGRNTIFKYIAKSLKMPATQVARHSMVAEALGHVAGYKEVFLIVQRWLVFDPDLVRAITPGIKVYFYRPWSYESFKWRRASVLPLLIFAKLREIKWLLETLIRRRLNVQTPLYASETSQPSLLVLQEDDLSLDRSYRTQPHWLFAEDGKPPFRTIVLQTGSVDRLSFDNEDFKKQGIIFVSKREQYLLSWRCRPSSPVRQCIRKDLWKCILTSVFGSSVEVGSLFWIAWLLYNTNILAVLCERSHVKAFMTCENYMEQADAMQLIAPYFNITTLSYQYSNMSKVGPVMMTTADMMLTFAPLYHQRWAHDGIRPKKFVDMGYLYDTSFDYVRQRAREHRRRLTDAGAQFIICYFDESVQTDKYGLISVEDHCTEILTLLRLVLDDPSIGIIVKTQFQQNSPQHFDEIASVRAAANASGRYVELAYGIHRNIIFPAEAALSADITIAHAAGATAALEAALTKGRCILLNPYGMRSENDFLYAQTDIFRPSLADALEAIESFRKGTPDYANLGDWSSIIDQFDPFRDGNAGHRFRKLLEQVVLRPNL